MSKETVGLITSYGFCKGLVKQYDDIDFSALEEEISNIEGRFITQE